MDNQLIEYIRKISWPLKSNKDLDSLIERMAENQVVMLGEASHGSKEFYIWRSEITKRLIEEKNFSFIAVEGDWPDCYELNRFIKSYGNLKESPQDVLVTFKRWPTWMWANETIAQLLSWIKAYNTSLFEKNFMVGFYGLDVYSLWESMEVIVTYLKKIKSPHLDDAYKAYLCFEPYHRDIYDYTRSTAFMNASCQKEVIQLLSELRTKLYKYEDDEETAFNAEQNAWVIKNAEKYYRTMIQANDHSWNVRDKHMMQTLLRLLKYHGPDSKAIVWAHNTHIGDARATPMFNRGLVNIGQLGRQILGEKNVFLLGFGSFKGSVIAGSSWGAPMQEMILPEALRGSWEHIFHAAGATDKLIFTEDIKNLPVFQKKRGHRAIGVVYDPEMEWGNYVPTKLSERYDAFIYLDHTHALDPIPIGEVEEEEIPETFPTGI